jgi:hypothetical protein
MNATNAVNELDADEIETLTDAWKVKKVYTFGKHADATVTTFYGTPLCVVERHDPVGTYPTDVKLCNNYSDAHGIAKLHALTMNAKYN